MKRALILCLAVAVVSSVAIPLQATIIWTGVNGPTPTQDIMDECYGGQDPGPVEVDECGCNALGYPYSWDGGGCVDELNPGG